MKLIDGDSSALKPQVLSLAPQDKVSRLCSCWSFEMIARFMPVIWNRIWIMYV